MAGSDFYNFDEALDQLRLKEEELKRLVSEGEIRAFREGDTMKLRREDVEHLKRELMGGEVVDLGGDDEIVFEDDAETGMATEEISDMDTLLEEDVEEVDEIDLDEPEAPKRRAVASTAPAATRRPGARGPDQEEAAEGMLVRVCAILTAVVLILGMPLVFSLSKGHPSDLAKTISGWFGKDFSSISGK